MPAPEQLPPPASSAEEIRRKAEEILSRPEFQPEPKSLYERAVEWFTELLDRVVNALFSGGRSAVIAWLAFAFIVAVVAFLVFKVVTAMRRDPATSSGMRVETEPRRPATDWEREAAAHAAAGRWRDAVRCRYRALVARLASVGAVDEIPGRTAGEYRLDVRRSRPDAAPPFGEATDMFERVWYGHRDAGAGDDDRFRELADEVVAQSRR